MENWADTKSPGGLRWRADTTPPHCQVMGTCWWTTAWLEMIYQLTGFIFCFLETIRARCGDTGRQVMTKVRSAWQTPATPSPLQFNNIFLNCLTISAQCLMVADPCWAPCSTSQLGLDSGGRGGTALHTGDVLRTDLGKIGASHGNRLQSGDHKCYISPSHFLLFATILLRCNTLSASGGWSDKLQVE